MSSLKNLMAACPNIEVVSIGSPSAIAPQRVGPRPIYAIARDIRKAWGAKVNYAAKPYLDAMASLDGPNDSYGCDSASRSSCTSSATPTASAASKPRRSRPS